MQSALGYGVTGLQGCPTTTAVSLGVLSGLPETPGPCSQRMHVGIHLADATVIEQSTMFLMNSKSRKKKKGMGTALKGWKLFLDLTLIQMIGFRRN